MNKKDLVKLLTKAVGAPNVLASPPDLIAYSYDATGKYALPDVIVFPTSTTQVSAVMEIAHRQKIPVVPRGAGTNLSGGTVPNRGGIIVELSRLNRILEIDTARQRAVVEPGVINLDLQNVLQPLGFMYAPDPASQKSCTLGGNLAEDAGGPHCLKYGVTSNHIRAVELVLVDGEVVQLGDPTDDSYGYDLLGPVVGSEGTMGIATKLVLRLMRLPEAYQTMLAIFDTLEDAGQAVSDIIAAGIVPGALELLDNPVIRAIEDSFHVGYPLDCEALLLIDLDGVREGLPRQAERVIEICRANKAREVKKARTTAERDGLWRGRRGAFGAVARVRMAYSVQDATVPRNKLVPMLREVSRIAQKYNLLIGNAAHAGDGNLHPLIMYDSRDPDESERVEKAGKEILMACVALDGSISGEHGIGLQKLKSMPVMFTPSELELMQRVKKVFDPDDLLNPGKAIPTEAIKISVAEEGKTEFATEKSLYDEIVKTIGANSVLTEQPDLASYWIEGKKPFLVVLPANNEQVCQMVKIARREGIPIAPWGNGSKQHLGLPPAHLGIVLSLKHMERILEVDAPNLTAEVEAGINHARLQRELAKLGLRFPLEPEDMDFATIGGSLAANSSGPSRLLYGTARDLVLRVTMVTPQGEVIRAGSKTMKNVAGYDLRKLFFGSWGTLGVITRAVLRLTYLPEEHKTVLLRLDSIDAVAKIASAILNSFLRPESMELIDAKATRYSDSGDGFKLKEGEFWLLIGVGDNKEVVERHITEIQALAEANGAKSVVVLGDTAEQEVWESQKRIRLSPLPGMVTGKAVVPINKVGAMYQEIQRVAVQNQLEISVTARLGNGILYPAFVAEGAQKGKLLSAISELNQAAAKSNGFFILEAGPLEIRQSYNLIFQRRDYELMKRLKQAFDPKNIFNPGKVIRE